MAQEIPETTYVPEVEEDARKERERRSVQEGTVLWRRRKEELRRQKHREQRELQQILENYSPWGKPGGGAPCAATLRKKNVPLEPPEPPKCHNFGQGWTSNSTIERLHNRGITPLVDTDMNKFLDDKAEQGIVTDVQLVEDTKNRYNEEIQVYELTGGVELVPLLTSRRYYSQPPGTRHVTTDATRPGYTIESYLAFSFYYLSVVEWQGVKCIFADFLNVLKDNGISKARRTMGPTIQPWLALLRYSGDVTALQDNAFVDRLRTLGVGNREYITELTDQVRRKREKALEERRMEQESCRRHFDTWRKLWGKPGHGAPIDHAHRNNLYNILYRPAIY